MSPAARLGRKSAEPRKRTVVLLTAHRGWPAYTDPPKPSEPDRGKTFRLLARYGFAYRRLDPHDRPWNPFARAHSVLCALDPLRALRVLLLQRDADVVLCFYESAALPILLLRGLFRFRGKVVIYDVGDAASWRLRALIQRLVLRRAELLLPLESNQTPGLVAMGARPDTIVPVLDGTCTDFYPETEDRPEGYVLAMGDDVSRDYPTLLQAVSGLSRKVVVRSRRVQENRATFPNVTVLAAHLSSREYQELIAGAVLVVLPLQASLHPGGITSLLEAMSSGKAVIVSASPGLADHALDGVNCRVVPPDDPAAMRAAIDELLADPRARRQLGVDARRFVVENCSAEAEAERFSTLFSRLLDAPPVLSPIRR